MNVQEMTDSEVEAVSGACGDGNNSDLADTIRDVADFFRGVYDGLFH